MLVQLISPQFTVKRLLPYGELKLTAIEAELAASFWNDWPVVASDVSNRDFDDADVSDVLASGLTMTKVLPRYLYASTEEVRHFTRAMDTSANHRLTALMSSTHVSVLLPPLSVLQQLGKRFQQTGCATVIQSLFRVLVFPLTVFVTEYLGLPPFANCFEFYRRGSCSPASQFMCLVSCVAMLWRKGRLAEAAAEVQGYTVYNCVYN